MSVLQQLAIKDPALWEGNPSKKAVLVLYYGTHWEELDFYEGTTLKNAFRPFKNSKNLFPIFWVDKSWNVHTLDDLGNK